jgi:hypothetical protein
VAPFMIFVYLQDFPLDPFTDLSDMELMQ